MFLEPTPTTSFISQATPRTVEEQQNSSPTASWYPLQTSSSYDMWELPSHFSSRPLDVDEQDNDIVTEERNDMDTRSDPETEENERTPEAENSGWTMSSFQWNLQSQPSFFTSFSRTDNTSEFYNRQRLNSENSAPSLAQTESTLSSVSSTSSTRRRRALGDATNTAPILRVNRSRFL